MPAMYESDRVHASPATAARKRLRYLVAAIATLTTLFAFHAWTTTADASNPISSRTSLEQQLRSIKQGATNPNDAAAAPAPVSAHHAAKASVQDGDGAKVAVGGDGPAKGPRLTAKIITCPACRLNALPSVKKFVHEHAKHFEPHVTVSFQFGEDPVLHLFSDGKETKAIPLEKYKWDDIVRLLVQYGIQPTTQTAEITSAMKQMKKA